MSQNLTLILGDRQTGRTTKICELLQHSSQHGHGVRGPGKSLLIVASYQECDFVDRTLVEAGWFGVLTKTWDQIHSLRDREWAAVGVEEPSRGWTTMMSHLFGLHVDYQTVLTQGPLTVVQVPRG